MPIKPLKDLDAGTLRHIDWQELLPAVTLLRALAQSFRILPVLGFSLLLSLWFHLGGEALVGFVSPAAFRFVCWDVPVFEPGDFPPRSIGFMALTFFIGVFFLLALARGAAVRLASTERSGMFRSLRFAARHYLPLLGGFLIPIFLGALCLFPCWLLQRTPSWVSAVCVPIPVLLTIAAALILFGLLLASPMTVASVAVDRCDGFDAFSRSFAYLFRNPVHYLCYALILTALGYLGVWVTMKFACLAGALLTLFGADGCPSMFDATVVRHWHDFWLDTIRFLPFGFAVVYFQTAFTALYFMLRRLTDDVPFDQFAPDHAKQKQTLPPIVTDEQGAPVMVEPAESAPAGSDETGGSSEANRR